MSFKNRWRIEGTLTTISLLHIGSGATTTRHEQIMDKKTKKDAEISAVATDHANKPYLPGATLKGNLRAYLKQGNHDDRIIRKLFGSEKPDEENSCGGALEFWNAMINEPTAFDSNNVPYWDNARLTGVTASAVIDRQTRTAADQKLFYTEYVPERISFKVVITGQDIEDDELVMIVYALNGFNDKKVKLGAGEADGWGGFKWNLGAVKYIDGESIKSWLAAPESVGYEMQGIDKKDNIDAIARTIPAQPSPDILILNVKLIFNSPFLVNDPSKTKKHGNEKDSVENKIPDHHPIVDTSGKVLLPSRSIRGAFRSQAERILRTIGGGQAACFDHEKAERKACKSVYDKDEVKTRCPACMVFGLSGWRSPIQFNDFTCVKNGEIKRQQFVAIDRFTGGGVDGAKFDADYADRPVLNGTITIDLDRLKAGGAGDWGLGLIALTLRDLMERDITLGFGTAKGYGACRAEIGNNDLTELKCKLPSKCFTKLTEYIQSLEGNPHG